MNEQHISINKRVLVIQYYQSIIGYSSWLVSIKVWIMCWGSVMSWPNPTKMNARIIFTTNQVQKFSGFRGYIETMDGVERFHE